MSREDALKEEEQLSVIDQSTTIGTLLEGTDCKILLDSAATKSLMSNQYYLQLKSLHGFLKFTTMFS